MNLNCERERESGETRGVDGRFDHGVHMFNVWNMRGCCGFEIDFGLALINVFEGGRARYDCVDSSTSAAQCGGNTLSHCRFHLLFRHRANMEEEE